MKKSFQLIQCGISYKKKVESDTYTYKHPNKHTKAFKNSALYYTSIVGPVKIIDLDYDLDE